jgi:hypothetical protein
MILKKHWKKILIGVLALALIIIILHLGGSAIGMIQRHLGI